MTKLIVAALLLLPIHAQAVSFAVIGAKGEVIWSTGQNMRVPRNVGAISIDFFNLGLASNKIENFDGDETEITYVNDLGSDIKVISENETEYFQWCFTINGFQPSSGPQETVIADQNTRISWYYGFSLLRQGEWVSECNPASQSRAKN